MNIEEAYSTANIKSNKDKLQHVQDITSLVLGIVSGILTLESLYGFLLYVVGLTLANGLFYVLCGDGKVERYFKSPVQEIFVSGVVGNIPGFVMMWCLVYALVSTSG
ncbi:ER membrane protein complex subunit 6 [Spathaspora sp. JA1]|nr:ER membrane protein complex subunit 6 [Spathaspora sp. JA1]